MRKEDLQGKVKNMAVLNQVKPEKVFYFFEKLCQIPHGTFDTKRISDYCVEFAKERGLEVQQDEVNNVIIKKPGTTGYENSEPVILQGHLDMVCEKIPDSDHDFKNDGLDLYVENGYVKARGTTLGGDDGIAVSMAMAVLDSDNIPHPPIEAVFTVDEETGMLGAEAVDLSGLKGRKLLNIDSEEEGVLTCGCAGGILFETKIPVEREMKEGTRIRLKVHGLLGGHSGNEIHRQRGNAHKMLGRLLYRVQKETDFNLISITGGSKDNVIASESEAVILAQRQTADRILEMAEEIKGIWLKEFMGEEPTLDVTVTVEGIGQGEAMKRSDTEKVIAYLMLCPNGLQEYNRKLTGLVETSLNLGVVETFRDTVRTVFHIRSSVESRKQQLREQLEQCGSMVGGRTKTINEYPAWQFDPESQLLKIMMEIYEKMFEKEPIVSAVHAGVECGLFLGKRPDLDCVSFGPNIRNVHSFNEKLDIASTERTWAFLKEILKELK